VYFDALGQPVEVTHRDDAPPTDNGQQNPDHHLTEGTPAMPAAHLTVRIYTRDELLAERAELVARAGGDEDRLRQLGAEWALDAHGQAVLDELDRIDYLLGAE